MSAHPGTSPAAGSLSAQAVDLLDRSPLALIEWDASMRVARWSARAEQVFGWRAAEVQGKGPHEFPFVHPADYAHVVRVVSRLAVGGESTSTSDNRNLRADGTVLRCRWFNTALRDAAGRLTGIVSLVHDVTAEALLASEHAMLVDTIPAAVIVADAHGRVQRWNREAERLFGMPATQAVGRVLPMVPPEDQPSVLANIAIALAGGVLEPGERRRIRADGTYVDVERRTGVLRDAAGVPTAIVMTYVDISARKAAEHAVRESEARYAAATDAAGIGVWDWDVATDQVRVSPRYFAMLGVTPTGPAETASRIRAAMHPEDAARWQARLSQHLTTRAPYHDEVRLIGEDGVTRWLESFGQAEWDAAGRPVRMRGSIHDVTARRAAEAALRASEERHALVVASSQVGVWDWDVPRDRVEVTPQFYRLLGYAPGEVEVTFAWFFEQIHPEDRARAEAASRTHLVERTPYRVELRVRTKGGAYRWFETTGQAVWDEAGRPLRKVGWFADVQERHDAEAARRELEQQLLQVQKMEAIGTLAGGIAHDFNNILGAILGFTELARMDAPEDSELARNLEEVVAASERAKALVARILSFSRRAPPDLAPVHLGRLVDETRALLRATLPANVRLDVAVAPGTGRVMGNATQLQQVLLNLAGNAEYAMRPGGGVLAILVGPVEGGLQLVVRDTGCGIPPEVAARVFEPFFTTKPVGDGTGMGLAVVHGIVHAHHGRIRLDSTPGAGTLVEITLPRLAEDAAEPAPPAQRAPADPEVPPPGTRILAVDDEPALVAMLEQLGHRLGLHITACESPHAALARFAASPGAFDVLVTDSSMPGMSGEALVGRVRALRPELPVILCTGFDRSLTDARIIELGLDAVLHKPVAMTQILRTLARALAERGSLLRAPGPR